MKAELDLRPYQIAIVIGVDHKIQRFVQGTAPSHPRNLLRLRFLDFLRDLISCYPVDVICEESKHGGASIAERVANREHNRYVNIEMPPERRDELGIPPLYTIDQESEVPLEQKAHWNAQREGHMLYEIVGAIAGARAVIVICGVIHMLVMIQALRTKFARVEQYDVTAMLWFDPSLL